MFQTLKLCSYLEPHKLCLYLGIEIYLVYSHIFRPVFVKYNPNYTGRPLRGPGIRPCLQGGRVTVVLGLP